MTKIPINENLGGFLLTTVPLMRLGVVPLMREVPINEVPTNEGPGRVPLMKEVPINEGPINEGLINESSINEGGSH